MQRKHLFFALAAALILGGCGSAQQTIAPASFGTSQSVPIPGPLAEQSILKAGASPDRKCPSVFTYCVTLSPGKSAQLYFCYSPGSYCGPSQYQYYWAEAFYTYPKGNTVSGFSGTFNPNPGDPTYDTLGETFGFKSTHGRIKYDQAICPYKSGSGCIVDIYVGIRIK